MNDSTISDDPTPVSIARACASFGWQVLPLYPERGTRKEPFTPAIRRFSSEASSDPEKITEWWSEYPDRPVGIATTRKSGFWVLDIDVKRKLTVTTRGNLAITSPGANGFETLAQKEQELGPLPETFTVRTPSGGEHRYFAYPAVGEIMTRQGLYGVGIDTRGWKNGMVVAPGTLKRGTRYEVINEAAIVPAPRAWETIALDGQRTSKPYVAYGVDSSGPVKVDDIIASATDVPVGQQDQHITMVLFQLRQRGATRERMLEVAWEIVSNFEQDPADPWQYDVIEYKVDHTRRHVEPALGPGQDHFISALRAHYAAGGK